MPEKKGDEFPFLFGRAFIEALGLLIAVAVVIYFPSFLEGLSLRLRDRPAT